MDIILSHSIAKKTFANISSIPKLLCQQGSVNQEPIFGGIDLIGEMMIYALCKRVGIPLQ